MAPVMPNSWPWGPDDEKVRKVLLYMLMEKKNCTN